MSGNANGGIVERKHIPLIRYCRRRIGSSGGAGEWQNTAGRNNGNNKRRQNVEARPRKVQREFKREQRRVEQFSTVGSVRLNSNNGTSQQQ